jgi:putative transposase
MINDFGDSRSEWLLPMFSEAGKHLRRISYFKFWQDSNMPKELETNSFIDQKLDYIHENPVKELIVFEPEMYIYSSAIDYAGGKGLLDIEFLD